MLAIWVIGMVNCREYWMNAWHVAQRHRAVATRSPPMTAIAT